MTILPASRHDFRDIAALLERAELPLDGLSAESLFIVAREPGGPVVGCAALEEYASGVLLRSVAVEAPMRGTGLGGRLTRTALELAARRGATAAFLLTTTAGEFFPKFGFAVVERAAVPEDIRQSVEFTTACPATAVVMRAAL